MPETWPDWIDTLKRRYLADEASVFLLTGAVAEGRWLIDGERLDCAGVLRAFLTRSREILGTYDPDSGLSFASVTDQAAFTRHVETRRVLDGAGRRNLGRTPEEVLAQLYLAITTPGPAQGYIIHKVDQLARANRKNLPPLADGAPHLAAWAAHRAVRGSNNVVVLLAPSVESVRADLALAAAHIHVPAPPDLPELAVAAALPPLDLAAAEAAARAQLQGRVDDASALLSGAASPASSERALRAAAEAELEAALAGDAPAGEPASIEVTENGAASDEPSEDTAEDTAEASDPSPDLSSLSVDGAPASPADIEARLRFALRAALLRHPEGAWADKLPAREAVAATFYDLAPERFGALDFHVVEGEARVVGEGAEAFTAWWSGDIAVDAAAGMALSSVEVPEGGLTAESLPALNDAALRALSRRMARLLGA